jgi:uncharacterized protein YjeT (DUF2065 family)
VVDLIAALGLVLVLEGLIYGAFPAFAKRLAAEALTIPESMLRIGGIAAMAVGVVVVWLVRG